MHLTHLRPLINVVLKIMLHSVLFFTDFAVLYINGFVLFLTYLPVGLVFVFSIGTDGVDHVIEGLN